MKNYLKYYGIIYVVILVLFVILGLTYIGSINDITKNKLTPSVYSNDSVRAGDIPYVKGSVTDPIDVSKAVVPDAEVLAKGKSLFETTCAGCHGAEGSGDGIAGATLNPKPRNFHSADGWKNSPKISGIYKTLQEGIPGSGMASYSTLPPQERFALIHYVRTFYPNPPKDTPDELKELDAAYNLSKGFTQPNQIPVTAAEDKLISENSVPDFKVHEISERIKNDKTSAEAQMFRDMTGNLSKAVSSLMNNKEWMESDAKFMKYITHYPLSKGFNVKIQLTDKDKITALYGYLKSIINS
ncbi:MAG TPA: cytochrome c [Ignavibacteria bacterium]|nr:cytochrome c [Ignavibacteria bacterium]